MIFLYSVFFLIQDDSKTMHLNWWFLKTDTTIQCSLARYVNIEENMDNLHEFPITLLKFRKFSFSQTFEEAITHMMTFGQNIDEKQLPIRLYQVITIHSSDLIAMRTTLSLEAKYFPLWLI